ncbi:hypothetical protein [Gloeobacter violaceus]|uniref:Gll2243 protein n=1 Tax=Gloeobacter violaceus (strain ATCC 29082 / PCC 7421) TaxID=251221 RepID=Q7NIE0_GLOVI|nr:hypothetical protein [Gloeobacter violaceus]BAC90184.1 gll2243 [Gloeobacter violaceus PCC 7421]
MKTHIAGLLALGLLLSAAPGMAQTTTPYGGSSSTTPSNPRSNPTTDESGPRSTEPRTDATPSAGTPAAERPGSSMDPMTRPGSSMDSKNKMQPTTPSSGNPRSNPMNDKSGPTSEPRTDATPSAGTPAAERPNTSMDPMKPDTSTKKSNKTSSGMGKSSDRVDVTRTTDLPESQSRSNDAVIADPPSGVSNTDPNLQPKSTTRPAGEPKPKP